ncbi:MAG: hypothetical protein M0Q13_11840 [Methanothrix sp.]|nr:hypothetical protein [Methanothrix sp.]
MIIIYRYCWAEPRVKHGDVLMEGCEEDDIIHGHRMRAGKRKKARMDAKVIEKTWRNRRF